MSELAAVLAAQKKRSGGSPGGPGAGGDSPQACDNYRVDLTGKSFGVCKCGFPKSDHVSKPFGSGSRSSATFAVKHAHPPSKHAAPSVPKPSPVSRRQVPSVPKHKPAVRHEVAPHMVPKPDHKVSAPMESSNGEKEEVYEAVYAFSSTRDGDLSFQVGQQIVNVTAAKPGWLHGEVDEGGSRRRGIFPEDFAKKTPSKSKQAPKAPAHHESKSTPTPPPPSVEPRNHPPPTQPAAEPRRTSVKDLQAKFAKAGVAPMPAAREPHHAKPHASPSHASHNPKPFPEPQKSVRELQQVLQSSVGKTPPVHVAASGVAEEAVNVRHFEGMYDFNSGEDGDLSFNKGDVITLIQEMDENWIECKDDTGRKGLVPLDYVKELTPAAPPPKPTPVQLPVSPQAKPFAATKASSPPSPFSQATASPASAASSFATNASAERMKLAVALYDFDPQQPEDIRLRKEDLVKVRSEIDEQWWEGVVLDANGKESKTAGVFPTTFVRLLTEAEAATRLKGSAPGPPTPKPPSAPMPPPTKGELQPNGMYKAVLPREYTSKTAPPPHGEWYSGKDTYSCQASLQSSLGKSVKTERYHIHRGDRSEVMLAIVQASDSPTAELEYKIIPFVPLDEAVLIAAAHVYGPKILQYASSKLGGRDGNGECWTLASNALTYAGAQQALGFNFGQEVTVEKLMPGDILQFKSCVFHFPGGTKTAGSPDHTAIVKARLNGNNFEVYEQNPNPVAIGSYDLDKVSSGEWKGYRPIPKKEDVASVLQKHKQQSVATSPSQHKPLPPLPGVPPAGGPPPPPPRQSLVKKVALYDFAAQEPGDLGLQKGQIVVVTEDLGDWCEGYIEATNESGQFPTAYVGDIGQ